MADYLSVSANSRHEYLVRAIVAGYPIDLLLDTGFTSPGCATGVGLDTASFRRVRQQLQQPTRVLVDGFQGPQVPAQGGLGIVELLGLDGSRLETLIINVGANLLGVCYFHRLSGFRVVWDLAARTMSIERGVSSSG